MWKPIENFIDKLYHKYCKRVEPFVLKVDSCPVDSYVMDYSVRNDVYYRKELIDLVKKELAYRLAMELLDKGYIKFGRYSVDGYHVAEDEYTPSTPYEYDIVTARIDVARRR